MGEQGVDRPKYTHLSRQEALSTKYGPSTLASQVEGRIRQVRQHIIPAVKKSLQAMQWTPDALIQSGRWIN